MESPIGFSRFTFCCSARDTRVAAVNILVVEPRRKRLSAVTSPPVSTLETPKPLAKTVLSPRTTATAQPGTPACFISERIVDSSLEKSGAAEAVDVEISAQRMRRGRGPLLFGILGGAGS